MRKMYIYNAISTKPHSTRIKRYSHLHTSPVRYILLLDYKFTPCKQDTNNTTSVGLEVSSTKNSLSTFI
jgi:hypothetical protein